MAQILAEDEAGRWVGTGPYHKRREIWLEFKAGISLFMCQDLGAFREAVENGTYVEYGKDLGFHHQKSAFAKESQGLLSLLLGVTENQKAVRDIVLSRMDRDRFFEMFTGREMDVQLAGGLRTRMAVLDGDPVMVIRVSRYGRDGLKVAFEGLSQEKKGQPK
ncbi:MAG: ATP-dependent helicase, partial [Clostridium sp.]